MKLRVIVAGAFALYLTALAGAAPSTSPVADAAMRGDRDGVRALLKQGADVGAAQGDGMTALHWAAERGDAALADMLLYAGANVAAVTRVGQYTPLHLASRAGSVPVVAGAAQGGREPGREDDQHRRHRAAPRGVVRQRGGGQGAARRAAPTPTPENPNGVRRR